MTDTSPIHISSTDVIVVQHTAKLAGLPTIPDPQTVSLEVLLDACEAVVVWANICDHLAAVREVYARFAAVAQYLARRDAAREGNAAMRLLEVRIGQLLPPPEPGKRTDLEPLLSEGEVRPLHRTQASEFRRMAEHAEVVEALVAESTEREPASRHQVLKAIRKLERAVRTADIAANEPPPIDAEPSEFSVIVMDPPWRYDNVATRGAAEDHYPTMSLEDLASLQLPAAENAHLYLWVTNSFMRQGFDLMDAWGFTYKTCLTWVKPQIGMGNYFRNNTEHVLFGVKGRLPTLRNNCPTWFQADRTRHSAKPESFYDLVESSSPGPYMEMFARRRRFGWHTWGNES